MSLPHKNIIIINTAIISISYLFCVILVSNVYGKSITFEENILSSFWQKMTDSQRISLKLTDSQRMTLKYIENRPLYPPGESLEKNLRVLLENRGITGSILNYVDPDVLFGMPFLTPELAMDFKNRVQSGGPWDYKTKFDPSYETLGNWNYGFMGAAYGFPTTILLRMAGVKQLKDILGMLKKDKKEFMNNPNMFDLSQVLMWGKPWDISESSFSDDPKDQYEIRKGIEHFNDWATKSTSSTHAKRRFDIIGINSMRKRHLRERKNRRQLDVVFSVRGRIDFEAIQIYERKKRERIRKEEELRRKAEEKRRMEEKMRNSASKNRYQESDADRRHRDDSDLKDFGNKKDQPKSGAWQDKGSDRSDDDKGERGKKEDVKGEPMKVGPKGKPFEPIRG